MSRRDQIRMSPEEIDAFLASGHTMNVATIGADGQPHLAAMWYALLDGAPVFWTYGKSQKIVNLRRDNRITCLVETGKDYNELRGVELVGTATILEDREAIMAVGRAVFERYTGPFSETDLPGLEQVGAKRVAVRIDVRKTVSWDHTKLGGAY
ncbi:MAG TPA: TIGR03618 family F420-dependent PPOX class oxidoreductase [Acidimicrobiales bacterium]|nr:TIGR03618 family F420-dependent PPOX class oxidoreductase [Acidimicrobiales bacterium]